MTVPNVSYLKIQVIQKENNIFIHDYGSIILAECNEIAKDDRILTDTFQDIDRGISTCFCC